MLLVLSRLIRLSKRYQRGQAELVSGCDSCFRFGLVGWLAWIGAIHSCYPAFIIIDHQGRYGHLKERAVIAQNRSGRWLVAFAKECGFLASRALLLFSRLAVVHSLSLVLCHSRAKCGAQLHDPKFVLRGT